MLQTNFHTLDNGLRLVHAYDPTTAMVAVNTLYAVGSRNESRKLTGMAHLFEHLMFSGSEHVDSFDTRLENAGGKSNAWTSCDFTNFYDTLPAQNIDTALWLESDRMLKMNFSQQALDIQKSVVIEEFKQTCLDRPYGDLFHHLRRIAYLESHPYSWPTIGLKPEHIASVTIDDVKQWFYSHYAPNSAILSIVGNVDFDTARARVEEWYGDIPRRDINIYIEPSGRAGLQTHGLPENAFRNAAATEEIRAAVPFPIITIAYPMAPHGTDEYYAADIITDILSAGRAARLNHNLVNGTGMGLISAADASILGSEGPGLLLFMLNLTSNADADIAKAIALLNAEIEKICEPGNIPANELERTLNNFEATTRFANIGYLHAATNLAMATYHGQTIGASLEIRRKFTPADITAAAQSIFSRPAYTLIYRPEL